MLLSPTAINTYLECPRKFYERYYLGKKSQSTLHTILGVVVHAVLKRFFDLKPDEIPEKDYTVFLEECAERLVQEEWKKADKDLENIGAAFSAIEKAKSRSRWLLKKWTERFLVEAESLQIPFREAFKKLTPTHRELRLKSKEYNLQGVIDALYESEKEMRIVDYKTGKRPGGEKERRQMLLYWLLCKENLGTKTIALECDRLLGVENGGKCERAELAEAQRLSKVVGAATVGRDECLYPCMCLSCNRNEKRFGLGVSRCGEALLMFDASGG